MARPRAADDFEAIRARLEELRRKRARQPAQQAKAGNRIYRIDDRLGVVLRSWTRPPPFQREPI